MGAPVRLIGVGRPDRGDDAAGRLVVRRLRGRLPPGVAILEREGGMSELFDAWSGADVAVIVDAMRAGGPPGRLRRCDVARDPLPVFGTGSTHGLGLAEAVELGRSLGALPRVLVVYGVEGAHFGAGEALTPAVEDALDVLAARVAEEVGRQLAALRVPR